MKFKKGDKVRVIKKCRETCPVCGMCLNKTGTILNITGMSADIYFEEGVRRMFRTSHLAYEGEYQTELE